MPSENLKTALLPHDIIEGNVQANLAAVAKRLRNLDSDVDLVVLPEMFNSGFTADPAVLARTAETNTGTTITTVQEWASKFGMHIWGGFTAVDNGRYYNRGFMVSPDGQRVFYDKRHLFRYGGESELFTRGDSLSPIISIKTWNVKMSICYDLRFPAWNRAFNNNYDILVVPANWAHARFFAWKHLLIARAIENQAYVLGCNREGHDLYGEYNRGDSQIFNNWGDDVADRRDDGTVYSTLIAETFNRDRKRFEPWRDADDFEIRI